MRKPIGAEVRDQVLHALAGAAISLLLWIAIPLLYTPIFVFIIALAREWIQHRSVYFPEFRGGSFRDIMFFVAGPLLVILIDIGVRSWV